MSKFVLSWRRKKIDEQQQLDMYMSKDLIKFLRENPGFRWKSYLPIEDRPINYLEIGVFKGENIVDMSKSYCKHPESKMYCVDPWIEYPEYSEYKNGIIQKVYELFMENMQKENLFDRIVVHRDFSHNVVPTFEDNFFDIAYIDGNHETEFVYKDAVMTFPKVKSGGYIIFDDYNWVETKAGIDKFVEENKSTLESVLNTSYQVFCKKL